MTSGFLQKRIDKNPFIKKRVERFKANKFGVRPKFKKEFDKIILGAARDPKAFFLLPPRPIPVSKIKLKGGKNNMTVTNTKKKSTANAVAKRKRKKGLKVSVFKKKKGYGVSSTR